MNSKERHELRYKRRRESRFIKKQEKNKPFDNYNVLLNPNVFLYSYKLARRGVSWKHSVQYYEMYLLKNIHDAVYNLKNDRPITHGFVCFDINERGKTRHIKSPHISERVVQKALCNECIVPILRRPLIYDNGACLVGRGVKFARDRLCTHLHRYFNIYGNKGWVLTIDFSKYFDNIDHEVLFKMLEEQITDKRLLNILKFYINEFGPVGLGLGSQVSQILAVFYPNKIDHFIKEQRRIKFYGRYMDDSYIISNSKLKLQNILKEIEELCKKYKIKLNPKKTKIQPLSHGVNFLHCKYFLTETGKVLKYGGREIVKRERRKLKAFHKKLLNKELTEKEIFYFYKSWRLGFKKYFDSKTLLRNTDKLYNQLFIEE